MGEVLWWIGNVALLVVVAPVVLLFANRVLRPIMEIKAYATDVLEHGVALTGTLDAVDDLVTTRQLAASARQEAGRYVAALSRVL